MADTKKRTRVFKQLIQNADKIFPVSQIHQLYLFDDTS